MDLNKEKRMKNLKKILMALVLVTLLVSSAVTIAIAEASYTGNVAQAKTYLQEAEEAKEGDGYSLADAKAAKLKTLHGYLLTVNPSDNGYAELVKRYNEMTLAVAYLYHKDAVNFATNEEYTDMIINLCVYMKSAPVLDEKTQMYLAYKCDSCGETVDFTENNLFSGVSDSLTCPNDCEDKKIVGDKILTYSDFKKTVNDDTLSALGDIVDDLYSGVDVSDSYGYYDVSAAKQALIDFIENTDKMTYVEVKADVYTGDIKTLSSIIEDLTKESTYEELQTALKSAYTYMLNTPVSPLTDDYSSFFEKYSAFCDDLVEKLKEKVNNASLMSDKVSIFNDFYKFIVGDGTNPAVYLSENVVNAYNQFRSELLQSFKDVDDKAGDLEKIQYIESETVYSDFDAFKNDVKTLETVGVDSVYAPYLIDELYGMASTKLYDPSIEDYASTIAKYKELCREYAEYKFVDAADSLVEVADKYSVLIEFREFVSERPLCEAFIDSYNAFRESILEESKALINKLSGEELPDYVAPGKTAPTVTYSVLNSLYSNLLDSYNKYVAAVEDKAAKLSEVKSSAFALYSYILSSVIDTEANYYDEFVTAYNELRENVANELFAVVNNESDAEKKIASLVELGKYLKTNPITKATILRYNDLVDALVTDAEKAASMRLSNIYIDIENVFAGISAPGATLEEKLNGAIAYDAYLDAQLDVTDPAYAVFLQNYEEMDRIVGDAMYLDIVESIKLLDTDELKAHLSGYRDFIDAVCTQNLVLSYRKAVKFTLDTLVAVKDKIESDYETVAYYKTVHSGVLASIEEFNKADGFEAKRDKFAKIYKLIHVDFANTLFTAGTAYNAVEEAYGKAVLAFEEMLLSLFDTNVSPTALFQNVETLYVYLLENPFSVRVADAYNEAVDFISRASCHDIFEEMIEDIAVYAPKYENGWTDDMSAITDMLDKALAGATVTDDFYGAYEILGGFEETPKLVDFAASGFADMLGKFNNVKARVIEEKKTIINSADSFADKVVALENFREFAEKYAFSADLSEYYNNKIQELGVECNNDLSKAFEKYVGTIEILHKFLNDCTIDEKILDNNGARKYGVYKILIGIAKVAETNGYIDSYDEIDEGDIKALFAKNQIVDKINRYVKMNGISTCSNALLATANTELIFINLLERFDSENSALSDNAKNERIAALGAYIVENAYPQNLVDIYNTRYISDSENNLKAAVTSAATEKADLLDFAELVTAASKSSSYDSMLPALTEAVKYFNSHSFDTTDLAKVAEERIAKINEDIANKTEQQKQAADQKSEISDYAKPVYKTFDHEDGKTIYQTVVEGGEYKNTATMKIETEANGNKYAQMTYTHSEVPYVTWSGLTADQGLVFDFDVMSHDSLSLTLRATPSNTTLFSANNGQLSYNPDGDKYADVQYSGYRKGIDDPIIFTPGEWTHVTIIINPSINTMEMLIDYVSIGTKKIVSKETSTTPYASIRFQTNGATYNTICYDNLNIYAGTSYRIYDKLEKMSPDEKFAYCVEMLVNDSVSASSRYNAYFEAEKLLGDLTDASAEIKEIYDNFDATEIKLFAHGEHIKNLEEYLKDVDVSAITTQNVSTMMQKVGAVEDYIEENRTYIDQTAPRFIEIVDIVRQANEREEWLSQIEKYVNAIVKFNRAPTLAALERYYAEIMEQYRVCELRKADKYATAEADPMVVDLLSNMAKDSAVTEIVSVVTIATLHSDYLPKRILAQTHIENSGKIIDAIDIIDAKLVPNKDELTESEYLEELLLRANENVDFVDLYLAVIRDIVNRNAYDADVEGITGAIEIFTALDEMFFANLQAKHFEVINERLTRYSETNSYIEKAGICTFVRNYIAENNVDMSGVDGSRYMHTLETYEAELENYKKDYEAILEANTQAFIGIVNQMSANVSYAKLKPLYTEAIEKYYYNMNSDSDAVQAALTVFAEIEEKLAAMEADGAIFVGYAQTLGYSTIQAQVYQALVNCSKYIDRLDTGVEGVEDAIELYNEKLAEYKENIEPINSEISSAVDAVCSFRTHSISETVLAVIKNILFINK